MHYATNYIRVIGDGEKPGAGKLFFFNEHDLKDVAEATRAAKAHHERVRGRRGRIASFAPTGDPAIELIGEAPDPPALLPATSRPEA